MFCCPYYMPASFLKQVPEFVFIGFMGHWATKYCRQKDGYGDKLILNYVA